jgi:hypothetical protein
MYIVMQPSKQKAMQSWLVMSVLVQSRLGKRLTILGFREVEKMKRFIESFGIMGLVHISGCSNSDKIANKHPRPFGR